MSDQEFTVKDRRRFTAEGEPIAEESEGDSPKEEASKVEAETTQKREKACGQTRPLPEVNFSTFIFSLGTSALMSLGELPDPNTDEPCQNLPLAKQTIDILGMLDQKTKGNLSEEEENLLSNLLYELRLKYVAAMKK